MAKRILITFLSFIFIFPIYVSASSSSGGKYFSYSLSTDKAVAGDIIKLCINANKTDITAAGFRLKVTYDQSILKYIGTETSSLIEDGTMKTNDSGSPIYSVYVCNTDKSSAPKLYGNIICYLFQVKSNAAAGKTAIDVAADQICDYSANQLHANYSNTLYADINEPSSDKAYLTQLEPLTGELKPVFSSETHDYTMDVPYDVSSVEFQASAGDSGSVKINRKTLYAAGKSTVIIATVTSADKQTKTYYIITVKREAKPQSSSTANTSKHGTQAMDTSSISKSSSTGKTKCKTGQNQSSGGNKTEHKKSAKSKKSAGSGNIYLDGKENTENASGTEGTDAPESTVETKQTAAACSAAQLRNIYITANGMPAYMGGMLVTVICLMCGILLNLWLRPPNKK